MSSPELREMTVVFCAEGLSGYGWFFHEADAMLFSLDIHVSAGEMTTEEALQAWEPYREHWPELYDLTPEVLEDEYGIQDFPDSDRILDTLPASGGFWHRAAGLSIPGVGAFGGGMVSNEIFAVEDADALRALREQLRGDYRIVAFDGVSDYTGYWSAREARRRIEDARGGPVHPPTMPEL